MKIQKDRPKYTVFSLDHGVQGQLKNIIFASSQKPDITFSDALNNEIHIERNEDKCLVYDKPIQCVITWKQLTDWYAAGNYLLSRKMGLIQFLQQSLSSPPEKLFLIHICLWLRNMRKRFQQYSRRYGSIMTLN